MRRKTKKNTVKWGHTGLHDCRLYHMYRFCSLIRVQNITSISALHKATVIYLIESKGASSLSRDPKLT